MGKKKKKRKPAEGDRFQKKEGNGLQTRLGVPFFWRKAGGEKERLQVWIIFFNLLIILSFAIFGEIEKE